MTIVELRMTRVAYDYVELEFHGNGCKTLDHFRTRAMAVRLAVQMTQENLEIILAAKFLVGMLSLFAS